MTIQNYNFDGPYTSTNELKNIPGVYVILSQLGSDYSPIDVGESEYIKSRIENHDRKDCWNRNSLGSLCVSVHYTSHLTEVKRREIESEIRGHLNPPCGDR